MLDPSWIQTVKINSRPLPIISEDTLMYPHENEVARLLEILADDFDHFEARFDLLYKDFVNKGSTHDTVKKTSAQFNWGVENGSKVARLYLGLGQTELIDFTGEMRWLLPGTEELPIPVMYLTNNRLGVYTYQRNARGPRSDICLGFIFWQSANR